MVERRSKSIAGRSARGKPDPRAMRPVDVVRLLNSTAAGEVISERLLRRHRLRAGLRIGDGRRVDLLRYAAWLIEILDLAMPPPGSPAEAYAAHRARTRLRQREQAAAGMEIGPIPDVADPARRERGMASLRTFCETYFPRAFCLPWSADHLKVIAKIERALRAGGLFALAMPRGSGKSALTRTAALWAILARLRRYVALLGSTATTVRAELAKVQTAAETNALLAADFPEVFYPIRSLDRIAQRQKGQVHAGLHTRMEWLATKLVFPTIEIDPDFDQFGLYAGPSVASGSILTAAGLQGGEIRGQNHYLPDGTILRPDFVLVDDPQTPESAHSPPQNVRREALLAGDVLGMAGPGRKISGVMCCTVIAPGDMADNILDRAKHPEWQGERMKMVYAWPANAKLWDEYGRLRSDSLRHDGDGREATEFYRKNRAAMDAGASVAWPARHDDDEISALQSAMNLKLRDETVFFAEYQNDPQVPSYGDVELLKADQVAAKTNGLARAVAPGAATRLTMFADIHDQVLFWMVCAWDGEFGGAVVDYGAFPDQHRAYFTLRDAARTLRRAYQGAGREGAIEAGLMALLDAQLAREFSREDGQVLNVERCLIDSGYVPDVVYETIRRQGRGAIVLPSRGQGIGAAGKPISEYNRHRGDLIGHNWWIPSAKGKRVLRTVHVDTNYWKTFVHARLAAASGDRGCLSIFGDKRSRHRMLGDHLTAEYRVQTVGRGRRVDEWKLPVARPDNHWLDCLVGCAVAASMLGIHVVKPAAGGSPPRRRRQKVQYMEI